MAAARQMLTQPATDLIKGKIVFIGDWATDRPYKDYLPYLVAKGALPTLTLGLARELAPSISVALIQPAMIDARHRVYRRRQASRSRSYPALAVSGRRPT